MQTKGKTLAVITERHNNKMMTLEEYLKDDNRNSVFREKLINYKFFYEVKYAAAKNRNDINIYIPEVDRDGYDVLLDDGDSIKPFQIKTVVSSAKTTSWKLKKNLLRPKFYNCAKLGFEQSPESTGVEGGFILIEILIDKDEIKSLSYYYTDIFILAAFECGFLKIQNFQNTAKNDKSIKRLLSKIISGKRTDNVTLTKSNLVKVKSVDDLLALADLNSKTHRQWTSSFLSYYSNYLQKKVVRGEKRELKKIIKKHINDTRIKT
jgi:hypothetical protein